MPKPLRWAILAAGYLLVVVVMTAVVLSFVGAARLNRTYGIQMASISVPTDEGAMARGRHLAESVTLCNACHGEDLAGDTIFDQPLIARIYAPNLTSGRGGIGTTYTNEDYARAIRHGVSPAGRGLMIMHADAYNKLGESDLGAIIAYVRSAAPVDNDVPATKSAVVGRIMIALGLFDLETMPLIPAEVIDHDAPIPVPPPPGPTTEYGGYLVSVAVCGMCHGRDLTGAPPIEPGAPPGPNIALYGLSMWTEEDFMKTIRTGVTPYGKSLNADFMPWPVYAGMTDEELRAIRLYLASLGG